MNLTLVEWNVQDFFLRLAYPASPEDLASLSDENWTQLGESDWPLKPLSKLRRIAEVIFELDADIIFLCEVGGLESLEAFNRLFLGEAYLPFLMEGNSNRGIESGFLVRKTLPYECRVKSHRAWPVPFQYPHEKDPVSFRLAAEAARYHDLGLPGDRRLSRDAPALSLRLGGKTIAVFLLVHLKSGYDLAGIDLDGKVRREAEFLALLAIREHIAHKLPGIPIFMTGDFNGRVGRPMLAPEFLPLYQTTDYEDALELFGLPPYERITQISYSRREVHAQQLDYFFVPATHRQAIDEAYVYRYHEDEQETALPMNFRDRRLLPSDHYPLVVRLKL